MMVDDSVILRGASISRCGQYRYHLWREWDASLPSMLLLMLNPSIADDEQDDRTITKSMAIARFQGCGRLDVGNLGALRSTDPQGLLTAPDPIGPENDFYLAQMLQSAKLLICAWGTKSQFLPGRVDAVAQLIAEAGVKPMALRLTSGGFPSHPMARGRDYFPATVVPVPFRLL